MDGKQVNERIESLIHRWCERRELAALGTLLPAWLANNGLTDGWGDLGAALRTASASRQLPDEERALLKELWVEVDVAVRHR